VDESSQNYEEGLEEATRLSAKIIPGDPCREHQASEFFH
jgi:hypothetical protein